MSSQDLLDLLRQAVEIAIRALQAAWDISRPWLHDGAQWIADRLAQ